MGVREFIDEHYHNFNAGEVARCARSLEQFISNGGKVMITLAGAMSTAQIGRSLAPAIGAGIIHAISCTGANLEEDLFWLVAGDKYEFVDWRNMTETDDLNLRERGLNRVTDTCIPEAEAVRFVEEILLKEWENADANGDSFPPHEYIYRVIEELEVDSDALNRSWLVAAKQCGIPVFTPGWADSTLGNIFAARIIDGTISDSKIIQDDVQRMVELSEWYTSLGHPAGLLQVGGGIAGDFPVCVTPLLRQDLGRDVPHWSWFAQISESRPSYGGYSGAPPSEKISWDKLAVETPKFVIESDATIVLPLILQYLSEQAS